MKVPFIDLRYQHEPILSEIYQRFDEIFYTSEFVLGPELNAFEEEFRRYIGARFAIGVGSGTDALLLTLRALGVGQNDQVIVPAFSFIACADVVIRLGAKPILVDVNPMNYAIDPEKLSHSISPRTKAIILVHLYGQSAPIDQILDVAKSYKLPVIEDVAQSCGTMYAGRRVGSFGLAGCFSFYPTKNLGCAGDGGLVITNDEKLAETIRKHRDHGRSQDQIYDVIGYNSRLDCLQAAVLRVKLRDLDEMNLERQENARYYKKLLAGIDEITLPEVPEDGSHTFNIYTIQTARRDELREFLSQKGVGTAVYYPVPLHLQPCLRFLGYKEGDFPISEHLSNSVLSLPIYPGLKRQQIEYVAECIREFFKGK